MANDTRATEPFARRFLVGGLYLGLGNWLTFALNFVITILVAAGCWPCSSGLLCVRVRH